LQVFKLTHERDFKLRHYRVGLCASHLLSSNNLPNNAEKYPEHRRLKVATIRNSLFDIDGTSDWTKNQIRPKPANTGSAKRNAKFRADQSQSRNNVVCFMNRIDGETGIAAHRRDLVVQTRSHTSQEHNDALALQFADRNTLIASERMAF